MSCRKWVSMVEPIRVMQVVGRMTGGGVESTVMNYRKHLHYNRVIFDFLITDDFSVVSYDSIYKSGGRIYTVTSPVKNIIKYMVECQDVFTKVHPDIVHFNMNALSVFPLYSAERAGVPVRIAHSHSTSNSSERIRTLAKDVLKRFSKIYPTHYAACSQHAAEWLFGRKCVELGKVQIIKNALELEYYRYSQGERKREYLGIDAKTILIGQFGRICSPKNQRFRLNVFLEFHNMHPDSKFILVRKGDGMVVERMIEELGISDSVLMVGPHTAMPSLYDAIDALLLPSLYEGFGMVAVEAQAMGVPVLVSTNVPFEAQILPQMIEFQSLDDGVAHWAENLDALLRYVPRDRGCCGIP